MVLTKGKRFIKKVPPSGVAPVFKLTLPHSVVHTHMHHLVDAEFDIATSASTPQTWHGRISPRRNKSRSEYTLQGWRLFAEAISVKAGDQVSFELVNRRRLVVRIIKTSDGRPLGQESPKASSSPTASVEDLDRHSPPEQETKLDYTSLSLQAEDDAAWQSYPSSVRTGQDAGQATLSSGQAESLSKLAASPQKASMMDTFDAWQADLPSPTPATLQADSAAGPSRAHGSTESLESASNFLMQLAGPGVDPLMDLGSGPMDDTIGCLLPERDSLPAPDAGISRSDSGSELELQLFSLNTMLRRLQNDSRDYQDRAIKAEAEVARVRQALSRLKDSADQHTRGMLRAGAGIEAAVRRLQAPELMSGAAQGGCETALAIRKEMMQYNDMLKGCIWRLLNSSG